MINTFIFKVTVTVSVISSDPPFKEVTLKALSDQSWEL